MLVEQTTDRHPWACVFMSLHVLFREADSASQLSHGGSDKRTAVESVPSLR